MLKFVPTVKNAMKRRYIIPGKSEPSNDFDTTKSGEPIESVDGTEKLFVAEGGDVPQGFPHCGGLLAPVLLKSSKMYPHDLHICASGSFFFSVTHWAFLWFGRALLQLRVKVGVGTT